MIRLRFGIQIDMRDSADFGVGDLGGEAVDLLSSSRSQITTSTTSGGTFRLNGRFDLSSEQTVLDSLVTGVVIRDNAGNLILSIAGVAGGVTNSTAVPATTRSPAAVATTYSTAVPAGTS